MSKSLNLFLPAIGGTALLLGLAYGLSSRDYGAARIETLQGQVEKVKAEASAASETASAEAARVAEMQTRIATLESAAKQVASSSGSTLTEPAPQPTSAYGLGRPALEEEVAAWDLDVSPDGTGLPEGRGDVLTGEEVFSDNCAACHGEFAEGVGNWPVLAGGFDTLADKDPVKTVGSYWPHLSTVFDYVHRSMPFGAAQTMSVDDTYAIVAYILYSNDLVDEDFELSHENFTDVEMYNTEGFIVDDRAETEYPIWSAEPCMSDCKDSVEITMRASVLDVTPEEEGSETTEETAAPAETLVASTDPAPAAEAGPDPALVAAGEKAFGKCKACHQIGEGAKNRSGPQLNGVLGRAVGSIDDFKYSGAMVEAGEGGMVWNDETLAEFLAKPRAFIKGTKMSFAGFKDEDDIKAMIAYLKSFEVE